MQINRASVHFLGFGSGHFQFGVQSVRSGLVRFPFGSTSDQNFRSQKFKISTISSVTMKIFEIFNFWLRKFCSEIGPNGAQTDPEWIPNGPRTDPERTPIGPSVHDSLHWKWPEPNPRKCSDARLHAPLRQVWRLTKSLPVVTDRSYHNKLLVCAIRGSCDNVKSFSQQNNE